MALIKGLTVLLTLTLVVTLSALIWYVAQPPDLGRLSNFSSALRGTDNRIINLTLTADGFWREPIQIDAIDQKLIDVLVAYEDQRFWEHSGVDLRALTRAAGNMIKFGQVGSGASTLTMQTVRLLDTRLRERSLKTKIWQMIEALRLEKHWTKTEILEAYFTLAPYGGNIEGIKAATDAWFQKNPAHLTLNEIALLVALPQSPERRRPDRFPEAAYQAKQVVLSKIAPRLDLNDETVREVMSEPLPVHLSKPTSHALHLAQRFASQKHHQSSTSLHSDWQRQVENILKKDIQTRPDPIQAAAMVVERKTGLVRAYVGSADYSSTVRKGAINYLTALRSPGSTLKPLIYAKALNRNLINFDHVFDDTEYFRSGYRPTNFSPGFSGKVGLKEALLTSLNIPAIRALEEVGPDLLQAELNTYLDGALTSQQLAGLSLAVGGLYLTPEQVMAIYLGIIDPGFTRNLTFSQNPGTTSALTLLSQHTADQLRSLLIQEMTNGERVAFKTGTSFARQDAWSIQIYKDHLVLAWLGTPDNEPTSTLTGASSAFPLTLEIGRSLELLPPTMSKGVYQPTMPQPHSTKLCGKLIDYPKDGTWIKSTSRKVTFVGDKTAKLYLNQKPINISLGQLHILSNGVQRLTAKKADCVESVQFFIE